MKKGIKKLALNKLFLCFRKTLCFRIFLLKYIRLWQYSNSQIKCFRVDWCSKFIQNYIRCGKNKPDEGMLAQMVRLIGLGVRRKVKPKHWRFVFLKVHQNTVPETLKCYEKFRFNWKNFNDQLNSDDFIKWATHGYRLIK